MQLEQTLIKILSAFFLIICRSSEIRHSFKMWLNYNSWLEIIADFLKTTVKLEKMRYPLYEKCPNKELFPVRIFLYSDWIRIFTDLDTSRRDRFEGLLNMNILNWIINRKINPLKTWSSRKAEFLSKMMSFLPRKFEFIFPIPNISFTFHVPEEYWLYFFC